MNKLLAVLFFSACVFSVQCMWVKEMESSDLWQGDIVLDPDEDERDKNGTLTFASIKGGRWPGGRVPYNIKPGIGPKGRRAINEAIANYHRYTCIRFHKRTNERAYITFYKGGGCSSLIGYRQGRINDISLAEGCWYTGVVMHEIGHSMGFYHEQSRPDRDRYVKIIFSNIPKRYRSNFKKTKANAINSLGTPYDYLSMMHYGPKAFGIRGKVTIVTTDRSKQYVIGQRKGFSEIDKRQLGLMYNRICTGGGGGGGGGCADKADVCGQWKQKGFCVGKYGAWMKINCCKTCRGGSCIDKKPKCSPWANAGYCTSSAWRVFMRKECCKSCTGRG